MSNYIDLFTKPKGSSWYYKEMGSRDKKTGKLKYYKVKVTDYKIVDCTCHMKRLHEKIGNEL
jgi:hypothetical protein